MKTRRHVFTVGHSNRSQEGFAELLLEHGIDMLVDVRSYPRSRRHPHFNRPTMSRWLSHADIEYRWLGDSLGGFRKPLTDSRNVGLDQDGFRGFADYMLSDRFSAAVNGVLQLEPSRQLALMCAERDPGMCHRQFIADHLCTIDVYVTHILNPGGVVRHALHDRARLESGRIIYDRSTQAALF